MNRPKGKNQRKLYKLEVGQYASFPYSTPKSSIVLAGRSLNMEVKVREIKYGWMALRIK